MTFDVCLFCVCTCGGEALPIDRPKKKKREGRKENARGGRHIVLLGGVTRVGTASLAAPMVRAVTVVASIMFVLENCLISRVVQEMKGVVDWLATSPGVWLRRV